MCVCVPLCTFMGSPLLSQLRPLVATVHLFLQEVPSLLGSDGGEDNIHYGRLPEQLSPLFWSGHSLTILWPPQYTLTRSVF